VLGKHLGLRRVLPDLKKVAYFGHFHHVERPSGLEGGYIRIAMCDEGWFWLIPIDDERTSIGLVLDAQFAKTTGVPPNQMLAWAIARCPYVERLCRNATFPQENGTIADFSYRCEPYAGPGYFLIGDAATFIDPIFSTGVCLAMMCAVEVADGIAAMIAGAAQPEKVRKRYVRYVDGCSAAFFRMVRMFYRPAFRDVLLETDAPLGVRGAVISLLAGEVFPRPAWSIRWRLAIFLTFVRLQPFWAVAPRKRRWSLLAAEKGTP
jgi:flavin-dependent dehydrogenase